MTCARQAPFIYLDILFFASFPIKTCFAVLHNICFPVCCSLKMWNCSFPRNYLFMTVKHLMNGYSHRKHKIPTNYHQIQWYIWSFTLLRHLPPFPIWFSCNLMSIPLTRPCPTATKSIVPIPIVGLVSSCKRLKGVDSLADNYNAVRTLCNLKWSF